MDDLKIADTRALYVQNLASSYGYTTKIVGTRIDISLDFKKIFSYNPTRNIFFMYKTGYSKDLDDRYAHYIKTCLKNNLPKDDSRRIPEKRYTVAPRGKHHAIYDEYTGSKIESYIERDKAYHEAAKLNHQWLLSVKNKGL